MVDENDDAEVNEEGLPEADDADEDEEESTDGPALNEFGDPIDE